MRKFILLLAAGVVCVVAGAQSTTTQSQVPATPSPAHPTDTTRTTANVPVPELTTEERAALAQATAPAVVGAARARANLLAQRAVRDGAEQAFRAPTAEEAAALAVPAGQDAAQEIPLPMGGYALKTDASGVSLSIAKVGKDGIVTRHEGAGGHRDR